MLAVVLATGAFLVYTHRQQNEAEETAERTEDALIHARELETGILDVEVGVRGFLITGDPAELRPYYRVQTAEDRHMQALIAHTTDGSLQDEVTGIGIATDIYLHGLAVPSVATGGRSPAELRSALKDRTRVIADIERRFAAYARDAERLSEQERERARDLSTLAVYVTLGGLALIFAAALTQGLLLRRLVVEPLRRVVLAMGRVGRGELSTRASAGGVAEIGELERGFDAMASSLEQQHSELVAEKTTVERLFAFSEQLAAESDLDEAARLVLKEVAGAAGAPCGALYVSNGAGEGCLRLAAARGLGEARLAGEIPSTGGAAGAALAQRRIVVSHAAGERQLGLTAVGHEVCVPLLQGVRVLGVLVLGRPHGKPFDPAQLDLVSHLADPSSVALAQVFSYDDALRLVALNRTLLDSTLDGIRLIDLDGRILAENRRMMELVGGAVPASMSHWDQAEHCASMTKDPEGFRRSLAELRADVSAVEEEYEFEFAGAGRVFHRFTAPVRDAGGEPTGRIVVLREVTAERQEQRLKDEFVATVTHELRTPLTSINGYLELLGDEETGPLTGDQRRFLEVISRNADRLLRLVNDLLFVARVEAGMLELELGEASLDQLVTDAVEAARPAAEHQGLELVLDTGDLPALVGDGPRLAQLVDNLLSNAVKFTPPGGRVAVATAIAGGKAVLTVADTGLGIPDEEKRKLFRRFFRASTATKGVIAGTGLGLSISKAIVEAHGGSIAVADTPGGGTTFTVTLPLPAATVGVAA